MLIPETLLDCLRQSFGISYFPYINPNVVVGRRSWMGHTPEQYAEHCRKMSERRLNMTPAQKKKAFASMSKGMKRFWENIDPEKEKELKEINSKALKKTWERARKDKSHPLNHMSKKFEFVEFPRINTYSGVITESEMEEINA